MRSGTGTDDRDAERDRAPLAASREHIHKAVHYLAHVNSALPAAAPSRRDQRFDERPFRIREVTGIAQLATIITRTIFVRPRRRGARPVAGFIVLGRPVSKKTPLSGTGKK
jgi:hypothetical protein